VSERPRPRVIVNCAVSLDGRLAYAGGRRARLSGPEDLARVQRLRSRSGAILVGARTVLLDDPSLRVHAELLEAPPGPPPLRVVLDSRGAIPAGARVLDGTQPTLIATVRGCDRPYPPTVERFAAGEGRVDLAALLEHLARRSIGQLLVEGGAEVIASFVRGGWVDELTVYVAPVLIGGRTAPSLMGGPESREAAEAVPLELRSVERLGTGTLLTLRPSSGAGAPL
jgi:riboflavin-specific deaminase-like protein